MLLSKQRRVWKKREIADKQKTTVRKRAKVKVCKQTSQSNVKHNNINSQQTNID